MPNNAKQAIMATLANALGATHARVEQLLMQLSDEYGIEPNLRSQDELLLDVGFESTERGNYRDSCKHNLNGICSLMSGRSKNGLFHITRSCSWDSKCDRLKRYDKKHNNKTI
jgi:hypothetical protein